LSESINKIPFPDSYWVIPGRFLAGEYPGARLEDAARRKLRSLLELGVDTFFDLTRKGELEAYDEILLQEAGWYDKNAFYYHLPIVDFGVPSREQMIATLDKIDSALETGRNIYIHCWGGIGRTGTVVGCYLVRHGLNGQQALDKIAEMRKHIPDSYFRRSPESDAQWEMVLNWKENNHSK
jgi:protein-tyrosine phosphatase